MEGINKKYKFLPGYLLLALFSFVTLKYFKPGKNAALALFTAGLIMSLVLIPKTIKELAGIPIAIVSTIFIILTLLTLWFLT